MTDKCDVCDMETNYFNTDKLEGGGIVCTSCYGIVAHFYKKGYLTTEDVFTYNKLQKKYDIILNNYLLVIKKLSIHNKVLFKLLIRKVNKLEDLKAIEVFKKERQFLDMGEHADIMTLILENKFFEICEVPSPDEMIEIKISNDRKEISHIYNAKIHAQETGLVTFNNY